MPFRLGDSQVGWVLPDFAAALAHVFGDTPLIGCTTAGEIGPDGYVEGSITGFSLPAREPACRGRGVLAARVWADFPAMAFLLAHPSSD